MFGVHRDLRMYVSAVVFISVAVAVAGIASFIYGVSTGHIQWPFAIFGVIALLSSLVGIVVVPRWYRHSTRVVSTVSPRSGHIRLEIESDSESTSLYATVVDVAELKSRIPLLMPQWRVQTLVGDPISAAIYLDPASHVPVAFRTSGGLLWVSPNNALQPTDV